MNATLQSSEGLAASVAASRLPRSNAGRKQALLLAQGGRCFFCLIEIFIPEPNEPLPRDCVTVDHFVPRAEGGAKDWTNRVLCCSPCNSRKGHRLPTAEELNRWNELGKSWPLIRPVDLGLLETKRCSVCGAWIHPARLAIAIRCGHEAESCSMRCKARRKTLRKQELGRAREARLEALPWWVKALLAGCWYVTRRLEEKYLAP